MALQPEKWNRFWDSVSGVTEYKRVCVITDSSQLIVIDKDVVKEGTIYGIQIDRKSVV